MKLRFWITLEILLMFMTSCNSISRDLQSTADFAVTDITITYQPENVDQSLVPTVSVEPEKTTAQSAVSIQTLEFPTLSSTPVETLTPVEPSQTLTVIPTKKLALKPSATQALLGVQIGSPVGVPDFAHQDLGCQWMGLAGQVLDIDDLPMEGLVVEVGGTIGGQAILGLAITREADVYGPGGYEIKLSNEPIASSGTAWAQVFDLDGEAISSPTYFPTYADCEKNLILLNFVQSYKLPAGWAFLPVVYNRALNRD